MAKKSPAATGSDHLQLRTVPLGELVFLDGNPKSHDLEQLAEVIRRRGFVDPPKTDAALDGQLVYGNGRVQALVAMRDAGEPPPRGIELDKDGGWLVPVQTGVDSATAEDARALAIEHNLSTAAGIDPATALTMFDPVALAELAGEAAEVVFDLGALQTPEVEPPDEFPEVDENLPTEHTCPECGYKWSGGG